MSKIDVSQWKEFKIDELFDKCILHKRKKIRREFDLSVRKTLEFDLPVVHAKHDNNGIMYYGRRSDFEITNKVIDIVQDGASSVGDVYPQFDDVSVLFNAYLIKLKNHVPTENQLVYLSAVLQRAIKLYFSYDNKCTWEKLKRLFIKLPVTSVGEPDWQYMDSYIAKRAALAHKYVSELAKAKDKPKPLKINGWKEFKVGDLLTKIETKKVPFKALDLPVNPTDNYDLPLVAAGVDNQGRGRYVDSKYATVLHGCLTVSANGANSGATFYQDSDFSILQDAYALELVDKYKSMGMDNIYLFLAAVIRRGLINNDWSNKATWTRVQKTSIKLPVISTGEPDWHYMDSYIAKRAALAHKYVDELKSTKNQRGSR